MNHPLLRLSITASLAVGCSIASASDEPKPLGRPLVGPLPNVVIILVDDLGAHDLTCCGSTYYETPNIDALADQGMRFVNGYAACAVCSPTRAAILTGRYPARHGITDWIRASFQGTTIPADGKNPTAYVHDDKRPLECPPNPLWMEHEEVTIAELLKPAGYTTCHIGKWHLGMDDWYPTTQGFDINIGGCDFGQPPSYFDPYTRGEHRIPTLEPRKEGEYLTDREADEAAAFIKTHAEEPFFLYYAPYAVHTPIQGKEVLVAKYQDKPKTQQKNAKYAAMIESVDDAVGKVMAALETAGVADRTLIIFTGDNGGLLGPTNNAPLRSGKGFPYEGGVRVPVIVRWPGHAREGAVSQEVVTSVDLMPTICATAGVELPTDRAIDGVDLSMHLKRGDPLNRPAVFWHFPHYRYNREIPYSVVRAGDWKLIKRYEGPSYELFNLNDDPAETTNLADRNIEKRDELNALLDRWLTDTGAKLPRLADTAAPVQPSS